MTEPEPALGAPPAAAPGEAPPPAPPSPRRRLSFGKRLLFSILVTLAVFVGTEGILRLTFPVARHASLPNEMIEAHLKGAAFRYDPDLYWYWPEGFGGPVNEFGFVRKKKMTMQKPEGVTRVVTFGDSQTFGAGMTPDKTYSAFAEEAMGPGWEVLNAGISGYRTLNVYRLLQLRIEAFDPDAIIIDCMPFDSPRDDGPIVGRKLSRNPAAEFLRQTLWTSRIYYLLRLGLEKANPDRPRWLDQATERRQVPEGLGNHDRIAQWGKERGVEVIFMQYAIMDEMNHYGCMTNPGELPPDHYIVPTCERLKASGYPAIKLYQDRNHLTELGNQLVGEVVAETLKSWVAGAPRPGFVEAKQTQAPYRPPDPNHKPGPPSPSGLVVPPGPAATP